MGLVRGGHIAGATLTLLLLAGCTGAPSLTGSATSATGTATDSAGTSGSPGTSSYPATAIASEISQPPVASGTGATGTSPLPTNSASRVPSGPVIVEPTQTDVTTAVGRVLHFNVGPHPGLWKISSSNEAIVGELRHGAEADGSKIQPGAKALAVGSVTVTLENAEGHDPLIYKISVVQ